jgi:hypothetical protein
MASNLNNHIIIQKLATDLGLKSSAEPVETILEFCREKVRALIQDFDGCMTPEEILPWLAAKLSTRLVEINADKDIAQIVAEYSKKKEHAFATLEQELQGSTEGITLRLSYRDLWEPAFVSIIDCRGRRRLRRYHTKWHELAHLLVMTDQLRMTFRRTHEPGQEKNAEEKLVDAIAGDLSFFPEFVKPLITGEISFEKIEEIRRSMCPDSSQTSSAINISKIWPSPCVWLEARPQAKKGEPKSSTPDLRAVKVAENGAARQQGLRMIPNFRVPPNSIIFGAFFQGGAGGEAIENLAWWEASSGTRLSDRLVRVQVKNMGDSVQALVTLAA